MKTPKNEYTEIAAYLRGSFRTLAGQDDHALALMEPLPATISREEFLAASNLPEAVNKFLLQLDAKVDVLLTGMLTSGLEIDFPHAMDVLTISASGLAFTTDVPLARGDWLEVVVRLGGATSSGIGNIAARNIDKSGTPVFTLNFTRIMEEEREKIIRYVFKEERRRLRETRLE